MIVICPKCKTKTDSVAVPEFEGVCPNCGKHLAGDFTGGCIDDFQMLAEIGRGNNGVVFLARQIGLGREVALKIMMEENLADPQGVPMFFKEARAVAKLNHPNIVQAIAAGRMESGNFYFAMELIDGPSVENLIDREGALLYAEALRIAAAIAQGMAYAWNRKGLIHGDIKPANIILQHSRDPKLADLGLAQFRKVEPCELMATPLYAPPEVIRGDFAAMGPLSDIYSFGATLYEMFSGDPPFPGTDINLVLKMQVEQTPLPLTEKMGLFNPQVASFVDTMLAKNPDHRPESWNVVADFFADALEAHNNTH